MSLDEYLKQNKIIGIEGIDTRALTRKLRISGAMRGILSTDVLDDAKLVVAALNARRGPTLSRAERSSSPCLSWPRVPDGLRTRKSRRRRCELPVPAPRGQTVSANRTPGHA